MAKRLIEFILRADDRQLTPALRRIRAQALGDFKAIGTAGSESGRQISRGMAVAGRETRTFGRAGRRAGGEFAQGMSTARQGVQSISQQLAAARRDAIAFFSVRVVGGYLRSLADTADEYTSLKAQLDLVVESHQSLAATQLAVFRISQDTGTQLAGNVNLYARLARSTRDFELGQSRLLGLTQSIAQATAISNTSVQESSAAIRQLGQALGSGQLRGDEFRSVLENAPRLAQALADGLDAPIGRLHEMAAAGELTTEVVVAALETQAAVLQAEFDQLPATIRRSSTLIKNAFQEYIGSTDQAYGVTRRFAQTLRAVAENFEAVGEAGFRVAGVLIALGVALAVKRLAAWTAATVQSQIAQRVATAAVLDDIRARAAQTAAMRIHRAAQLREAEAAVASARGMQRLSLVQSRLLPARERLAAATQRHAAALEAESLAARKSHVRLLSLGTALNVLLAAFLGWQIGRYLAEEFDFVRKAGVAMAAGVHEALVRLVAAGRITGERLRFALTDPLGATRAIWAGYVDFVAGQLARLPVIGGRVAEALRGVAEAARPASTEYQDLQQTIADINHQLASDVADLQDIYTDLFTGITAGAQELAAVDPKIRAQMAKHNLEVAKLKAAETKIIQNELTRQLAIYEQSADRLKEIQDRNKKTLSEIDEFIAGLGRREGFDPDLAVLDLSRQINIGGDLLRSGDLDAARRQIEEIQDIIRQLAESDDAAVSDAYIRTQARRLREFAERVGEAEQAQVQATQEQSQSAIEGLLTRAATLKNLKVGFDAAAAVVEAEGLRKQLEAALAESPIRVLVELSGAPGNRTADDILASIPGRAEGGPIVGPGGPRDDRVLVRMSNGEYAMRAAAVRHYGLDFMDAINRQRIPQLADGGLIGRLTLPAVPAPDAGPNTAVGTPVHLHLDGRQFVASADESVAADLTRTIRRQALKQGGRV